MSVYVDQATNKFGRMLMCHMVADTLMELHAMAYVIGVRRKWFQDKRIPHYDVCKSKRALAVKNGAIEIDRRELVAMTRNRGGGCSAKRNSPLCENKENQT